MKITLSPTVRTTFLAVEKIGESLIINGEVFDFSVIPDGATLPREAINCEFIAADVERIGGQLYITLLLPITSDASEAARFPDPIINPADGLLELPK